MKYSESGGTVEVSLRQNEMYLKLQVRDYGIGIDAGGRKSDLPKILQRQACDRTGRFGIGLYLAREIINLHGGFMISKRMNPGLLIEMNLPV